MKRLDTKVLKRLRRTMREGVHMSPEEDDLRKALKQLLDKGKGHIVDAVKSKRK